MPDLTDDELRGLLEMEAKATPGPVKAVAMVLATRRDGAPMPCRDQYSLTTDSPCATAVPMTLCGGIMESDARCFAAARNAIRPLVEELLRRRAAEREGGGCG